METYFRKITIIRSKVPEQENINLELQWIGSSLGLFNQRDKDRSCFRIFIELLKSARNETSLSSDELAYKLNLSRGTIIHHIHTLIAKGIVVYEDNRYALRMKDLSSMVEEVKKEFLTSCDAILDIAERVDKKLEKHKE